MPSDLVQRIATVSTRPLRFGFVVHRDIGQDTLLELIQFNSSIWGGKHNLFIPTDGSIIREDWYRILAFHDPDVVFLVGEIDESLIEHIYSNLQPMQIFTWGDTTVKGLFEDNSYVQPVLVDSILAQIYTQERNLTSENSRIRYPIVHPGPFAQYLSMLCGSYSEDFGYITQIKEHLGAAEINCDPKSLSDYLDLLEELDNWITPYKLTAHRLKLWFPGFSMVSRYTLIVSGGSFDDLCLFHAMRWSSTRMGKFRVCIVPRESISSEEDARLLATWYGSRINGNGFDLVSLSLPMQDLEELRDRIKPHLPERTEGWAIDLVRCNFDITAPNLSNTKRQQTVIFEDNKLSFELPHLDIAEWISNQRQWVCELELSAGFGNRQGFIPSMFRDLNALLSNSDRRIVMTRWGSPIRIARGSMAFRVTSEKHIASIHLPSHKKLIHTAFEDAGYEVTLDRTAYYQGLIGLIEGIEEIRWLQNENILHLLSLSEMVKGSSLTIREMRNRLQIRKGQLQDFYERIRILANRQILLRGLNLPCPICDLTTWYSISSLQEHMTCQGCFSSFALPVNLDFAFKLNTLLQDRQNQGSLTLLLTILLLHLTSRHSLIWQGDVSLKKAGEEVGETDLLSRT
jgi:hypothetical protein